ncbi:MAG: GNAT family N-acetyltransferase [Candidatus Omnitrophota bacterium]|nr:GNAT family N-acetyltransferase [Candidatus Omnitrophota bacterium]
MTRTQQIEICRAKQEDMPYIREKMQKYMLDATDINAQQFFVAKNISQTVAFGRIIDHGEFFELASLGVDYYHRKKGIGTRMLRFLIEQAGIQDPQKPIYGVTHRPGFLKKSGFEEIDDYPQCLEYKKSYICKLDSSKIKIMKQTEAFC